MNTTPSHLQDVAAYRLGAGRHAVGILTGESFLVGTEHETTTLADVVIFDDFGDAQNRYPVFGALVASIDETEDGLKVRSRYVELQHRRAEAALDSARTAFRVAESSAIAWRAMLHQDKVRRVDG